MGLPAVKGSVPESDTIENEEGCLPFEEIRISNLIFKCKGCKIGISAAQHT
jgi:hypothetical protein